MLNLLQKELDILRPFYSTNELGKFYGNKYNSSWIIYTDSSFKETSLMDPYPNIKKHLDRFKKVITSCNSPYGLHRSREENFFKGEKIISIRKCASPIFTYTDFDCYVLQTFYIIKSDRINLKYLTALFNSKLIAFWLKHRGKLQGINYQLDKEPLLQIPIRASNNQLPFVTLVESIISAKKENLQADTSDLENSIDVMVYKLYELSYDEVLIIDKEFEKQMNREEYKKLGFGFEFKQLEDPEVISKPIEKKSGRKKRMRVL